MSDYIKPEIVLLLLGASGAGKTTMINMFINFFFERSYTDQRLIAITQTVGERTLRCNMPQFEGLQSDQGKGSGSATRECNMYRVENESAVLVILDTPGVSDTRGSEQDAENIQIIVRGIQKVGAITAICLVQRATDCRANSNLNYTVQSILQYLPVEFKDNFVVCFSSAPDNVDINPCLHALKEVGINTSKTITFENSCLFPRVFEGEWSDKRKKKALEIEENNWDNGNENFQVLMKKVKIINPTKAASMTRLYCERDSIKQLINKQSNLLREYEDTKRLYQSMKKDLENHEEKRKELETQGTLKTELVEVEENKEIEYETSETVSLSPNKATMCYSCKNFCHYPCSLDGVYAKGSYDLRGCYAFAKDAGFFYWLFGRNTTCYICNHSIDDHGHTTERNEIVKKKKTIKVSNWVSKTGIDLTKQIKLNEARDIERQVREQKEELDRNISISEKKQDSVYRKIYYLQSRVEKGSMAKSQGEDMFIKQLRYELTTTTGPRSEAISKQIQDYKKVMEGIRKQDLKPSQQEIEEIEKEVNVTLENFLSLKS